MLAFSDLQAEIAAELIKNSVTVMTYNQRDVAGILAMIRHLGATVGASSKADALALRHENRLRDSRMAKKQVDRRRVYFEEWDSSMITGIKWVSELIEIAGGTDVFSTLASNESATDRVVTSEEVIEAATDIIIASWCGKKARRETFSDREGWSIIPAVQQNQVYEVKSPLIVQPGPAVLTDVLNELFQILSSCDHGKSWTYQGL